MFGIRGLQHLALMNTDETTLQAVANQLENYGKQLEHVDLDLRRSAQETTGLFREKQQGYIAALSEVIQHQSVRCSYDATLLHTLFRTKDDYGLQYSQEIKKMFDKSRARMEGAITQTEILCPRIKNKTSLRLIDKAKDNIRSVLTLYDKCIQVLEDYRVTIVENTVSNWRIDNAGQKMSLIEEYFAECFETDFVVPPYADRLTRTLTYQFLDDDIAIHDVVFTDGFLEKPVGGYKMLLDKWDLVETVSDRIELGFPNRTTVKANGIE